MTHSRSTGIFLFKADVLSKPRQTPVTRPSRALVVGLVLVGLSVGCGGPQTHQRDAIVREVLAELQPRIDSVAEVVERMNAFEADAERREIAVRDAITRSVLFDLESRLSSVAGTLSKHEAMVASVGPSNAEIERLLSMKAKLEAWAVEVIERYQSPDVVRTRKLSIVDEAGVERFVIASSQNGRTDLQALDAEGRTRVFLRVGPDGDPSLHLFDAAGKPRASLGLSADGSPAFDLRDAAGKSRLELSVREDYGSMSVLDANETERVTLGLNNIVVKGTGETRKLPFALLFYDEKGEVLLSLPK
jgi:hypothetical protein